jgi:hypothetical protein
VDDLTHDEKPAVMENFPRGVSEIDGTLDAVTKPKLFCQTHGDIAAPQNAAGAPHLVHNVASIMRLDLLLDGSHHLRRAQVHFLARRCAAGNEIGRHGAWQKTSFPRGMF